MKTRFYNEEKAKRVNTYQHKLQEKLYKSIKCRTVKEERMKTEIDAIASAYVNIICNGCKRTIQVKFKDWQAKKFSPTCLDCIRKKEHNTLTELHVKIEPFIPKGYEIVYDSYYNSKQTLAIRKKKE